MPNPSSSAPVAGAAGPVSEPLSRLEELLDETLARRRSPVRLTLFGNYGQGNIGDEAILHTLLGMLRDRAQVTVVSRDPARIVRDHGIDSVSGLTVRGLARIARSHVVAVGGGGIFGNNMALLPRLLPLLALGLRLRGARIVFVAIGAYSTTPPRTARVLRLVARVSDLVTVRDPQSREVLGCPDATIVDDPGMNVEPVTTDRRDRWLGEHGLAGARILGISLKPAVDDRRNERQIDLAVAAATGWLERDDSRAVLLLCFSEIGNGGLGFTKTDRTMALEVAARLPAGDAVVIAESSEPAPLMKSLVGSCDAVLAHRLHAQMFAIDAGRPLVGMTWERKSDIFLASHGVPTVDLRVEDPAGDARMVGGLVGATRPV